MIKNNPPPGIPAGLTYFIDAFFTLSTCRHNGPIPFDSILNYIKYYKISKPEVFVKIIQRMDSTYLSLSRQNQSADTTDKNKKLKERLQTYGAKNGR